MPFRNLVLPTLLIVFATSSPAQVVDHAGEWTGQIAVPGSPLGIEVVLEEHDGDWEGTIAIPAQNLRDFPLSGIEVDGRRIGFRMDDIPGTPSFDGELHQDGSRIEGTFTQGGMEITFFLKRADTAREEAAAATREALDGFGDFIRAAMDSLAVPGSAVTIVRGGEVVFLDGFGYRHVEASAPVTPQTQFAIGSSTKAFTAAGLGVLVDDGTLSWDTPIGDHLPSFRLADPIATAEMNAVDLLTHRSGLPRHDLLWYATDFDRRDLFGRLRHLAPTEPFRARWQYQNLMYLAAGVLTEELSGQTWEEFMRSRLLLPLGMSQANFSVDAMQQEPEFARGYGGGRDTVEVLDYRRLDAIGPAGSINASAEEMARWVTFNLGDGTVDGQELLSSGTLRFLHSPQVVVSGHRTSADTPYLMYALGWMVEPYRGQRMIQHGGNIDGFSALVGFLPDDEIGIVVLTNKNATPLPRVVMMTAFDRLLEIEGRDWLQEVLAASPRPDGETDDDRVEGTTPSKELAAFAGTYHHPGYGDVRVDASSDALRFDYYTVEGQLEHVHYDTFEFTSAELPVAIRLNFLTDDQGRVSRVEVPLEFSGDPIVFERQPDDELTRAEYLADFVGSYRGSGLTFTVGRRGQGDLALTVAGQGTWSLVPTRPDAFDVDGLSGFRVRFDRESGRVVHLIAIQPGATITAERVEE